MSLDPKVEAAKLAKMYKEDPRQATFNLLVTSESGMGKTFMMRTARKPVHIDSFDPGGTKGLRDWIKKGEVIPDTQYENEDPMKPTAFASWKANFEARERGGYFDHIGTYVLDSATTWSDAIMNNILKLAGIPGQSPRYTKDWTPQKIEIRNYIKRMLNLPCDFVLNGHLKMNTDGEESVKFRFMTTGQGMLTIPLLFDELYVLSTKETASGVTFRLLTKPTGKYLARSRLAADGIFDTYETPDIKHLLKKAGLPTDDKPLLTGGAE